MLARHTRVDLSMRFSHRSPSPICTYIPGYFLSRYCYVVPACMWLLNLHLHPWLFLVPLLTGTLYCSVAVATQSALVSLAISCSVICTRRALGFQALPCAHSFQ